MAEQKESSVLFSLKELMNLEEDRIKSEEDAKRRAEEAAVQARLDAEKRARDEEEGRIRAEEERRRAEESRSREEQARLAAIRAAELEKARLDAENAARIEAMRHQQEHDRKVTQINAQSGKKQLTMMLIGGGVLLVLVLVGAISFIVHQNSVAAAEAAKHQQELAESQAQLTKLQSDLQAQQDNVKNLEGAVAGAKDEAARTLAVQQLADAKRAAEKTRTQIGNVRSAPAAGGYKPAAKPACTCQSGDPLCSCM